MIEEANEAPASGAEFPPAVTAMDEGEATEAAPVGRSVALRYVYLSENPFCILAVITRIKVATDFQSARSAALWAFSSAKVFLCDAARCSGKAA